MRQENHHRAGSQACHRAGQDIRNHFIQLLGPNAGPVTPGAAVPDRCVSNKFLKISRGRGKHPPLAIHYGIHYPNCKYFFLTVNPILCSLMPLFLSNAPWISKTIFFPSSFRQSLYLKTNINSPQRSSDYRTQVCPLFPFWTNFLPLKPFSLLFDEPSWTGPYPTPRIPLKIGHNAPGLSYARPSRVLQAMLLINSRIAFDLF